MGYLVNLEKISLNQYRNKLKSADLLPSRRILVNNIEIVFERIHQQGIDTAAELLEAIKTKQKIQALISKTHLDEEYLTILSRELRSYLRKPNKLVDFPGIPPDVLHGLEKVGIKNSLQLYSEVLTKESRNRLAQRAKLDESQICRLAQLADLSRIRWVNHTFAFVLRETGYDTVGKVAGADHAQLYQDVKKLNEERQIYKGHIGLHDMKLCVEAARELEFEIEY